MYSDKTINANFLVMSDIQILHIHIKKLRVILRIGE